jgi:zinc protease
VAQQYLTDKRLIVTVKPTGGGGRGRGGESAADTGDTSTPAQQPAQTAPGAKKNAEAAKEAMAANVPKPQADPTLKLPVIQRRKLSNGLEVLIVEQHELPVVNMGLVIKSGAASDPTNMPGLASITADLWDEGTRTRNASEMSDTLAAIGARLNTSASWDASGASLLTLTRHLDKALELYADTIINPAFDATEFKRLQGRRLIGLQAQRDNANAIAGQVYASLLYGHDHPYGHPLGGNEASLNAITAEDARHFYETYYRPNNAALIVAGDVTPATIVPKLERALAGWKSGAVPPAAKRHAPPARNNATIYIVDKPGAAQSVIQIGQVGVDARTRIIFRWWL